ncbi:MAG: hypothetical protein JW991_03540 [Candidatus Pacebacteria bacterium]|nr:hypothetical protein [Candidatus Paceibacterota bacterium]
MSEAVGCPSEIRIKDKYGLSGKHTPIASVLNELVKNCEEQAAGFVDVRIDPWRRKMTVRDDKTYPVSEKEAMLRNLNDPKPASQKKRKDRVVCSGPGGAGIATARQILSGSYGGNLVYRWVPVDDGRGRIEAEATFPSLAIRASKRPKEKKGTPAEEQAERRATVLADPTSGFTVEVVSLGTDGAPEIDLPDYGELIVAGQAMSGRNLLEPAGDGRERRWVITYNRDLLKTRVSDFSLNDIARAEETYQDLAADSKTAHVDKFITETGLRIVSLQWQED